MAREDRAVRSANRCPAHPGAYIREINLPALRMTKSEFAAALGISRQMLHGILAERHPVTVEMAVKLGHVLGNGPDIWIAMQQAYDLWHAKRTVDTSKLKVLAPKDKAA
jgi:addiction module HigA family antidote